MQQQTAMLYACHEHELSNKLVIIVKMRPRCSKVTQCKKMATSKAADLCNCLVIFLIILIDVKKVILARALLLFVLH